MTIYSQILAFQVSPSLTNRTGMARSLALTRTSSPYPPLTRLLSSRNRSTRPDPPLIRFNLDADRDPDPIRKLEDAVHRIIVRRSQPDWLPFRPGSSYWVPPKASSRGFALLVDRFANSVSAKDPAIDLASDRGWPSSETYFKGGCVETSSSKLNIVATHSEDDES